MNILHRPKIVLLGMMSRMPVAAWSGRPRTTCRSAEARYDVYYVEAHGCTPYSFMNEPRDDGWADAAAFIQRTCQRFGLADKWLTRCHHDDRVYGMSEAQLRELYREAA